MIMIEFNTLKELTEWLLDHEIDFYAADIRIQEGGETWAVMAHGTFENCA